jgi:glutamine amidotransferase/cyclase
MSTAPPLTISLLDYGAGNVRSVRNALSTCGFPIIDISTPQQIAEAQVIIFPGVGSYHCAMDVLKQRGWEEPLKAYLKSDRPYLGICLGMQTLFECSEETSDDTSTNKATVPGLGIIPGKIIKFDSTSRAVPHIGWNGMIPHQSSPVLRHVSSDEHHEVYFVHSYYAPLEERDAPWVLTRTTYEGQEFVSSVQKGNVCATQFHPEKSGGVGLDFLRGFLEVRLFLL